MSKKNKALIIVGGTGGHVLPGINLANHLRLINFDVEIITDKRGLKYFSKDDNFKKFVLPSSPLIKKNFFKFFWSVFVIIFSILRSFIFLIFNRPSIIFGMGGYASFSACLTARLLKIKTIIYENNLVIGKTNKYLMPFVENIIVADKIVEGIPNKYSEKIYEVGNIINKKIIDYAKKEDLKKYERLNVLVLGGSQAAKIFAEILPDVFKECTTQNIRLKIYQHCLLNQNEQLNSFYKSNNIEFETFNFTNNIIDYFPKVNFAITRSGSSVLAELTNANIPFVSVPLPSSADNHQLKNAKYYKDKFNTFLLEEKDLKNKLFTLIKEIYNNNSLLENIVYNQRQHSDKNVYNNINEVLKKVIDEKD